MITQEEESYISKREFQSGNYLVDLSPSDPFRNFYSTCFGTYIKFDENPMIPKVMKGDSKSKWSPTEDYQMWNLHFDGARRRNGSGGGICQSSLDGRNMI